MQSEKATRIMKYLKITQSGSISWISFLLTGQWLLLLLNRELQGGELTLNGYLMQTTNVEDKRFAACLPNNNANYGWLLVIFTAGTNIRWYQMDERIVLHFMLLNEQFLSVWSGYKRISIRWMNFGCKSTIKPEILIHLKSQINKYFIKIILNCIKQ